MTHAYRCSIPGIVLCALTLAACGKQGGEEEGQGHVTPVVAVRSAEILVGNAIQTISATGRTEVLRREKVYSPVAGTITALDVLEGSPVRAGDVLVTILTKESQAAIVGAEALLRSAQTDRQKAEAERALQLARSTQNSVTISARFDGVVAARTVNRGEIVPENMELMTILDLSSVVFMAEIPLRDIDRIRTGMAGKIRLASSPERLYAGTVDVILPQSEPQSQTARVRLRFQGKGILRELRPDMGGTVEVATGVRKNALLVPARALLRDDEQNTFSIVIITPDSFSLSVPVEVGARGDSTVEVISPRLRGGMPVITEGHYMLADSTRVTVSARDGR